MINFASARRSAVVAGGQGTSIDAMLSLSLSADVTVTGTRTFRNLADLPHPAANLVGFAAAASQGAITARQLEGRPIMRAAEVLETVPGLVISQHSGEGKANQYYLRGFNLDHGTDFMTTVAGVPVNMPTHGHGHGYADANFLIPELVSGVQFRKGPYYAEDGDFSAAGSANINYLNALDRPLVRMSAGEDGWGRVFGAASPALSGGRLLAAFELNHNNGPWTLSEDFHRMNAVVRYSRGSATDNFSVTGMGYTSGWNATDQVPARAIESGLIPRFGHIDASDGGDTHRVSFSADLQRGAGTSTTRANAYVLHYALNLFSNFTYFLEDPANGDQFEQADERVVAGGRISYRRLGRLGNLPTESAAGVQLRHDAIGTVGLYRTRGRERLTTVREDEVDETSIGVYAQTEIEWHAKLRTTLGFRGDLFRFDVASTLPENSGTTSDGVLSPKLSAVVGPWAGTELYVNAGFGFHSNDARGATISIDPTNGEAAEPVTPLVRARGAEVGLRAVHFNRIQSTVTLWTLGIDSELLFVGDAGTTEASRPSRRYGLEWTNYASLARWLTVDFDLAWSHARFTDADPIGDYIPGAVENVASAGVTVEPAERVFGGMRLRYFGSRPLTENNSVRSEQTTLVNLEAGYRFSDRVQLVLDIFNLFDAEDNDIDYFYVSRLPGEPQGGVDDIHLHPTPPRTLRVGLRYAF
jgi:hypothetical protein